MVSGFGGAEVVEAALPEGAPKSLTEPRGTGLTMETGRNLGVP